ncbi:putative colanic acid biosynthesis acetyltransferase [uncultured Parabacteroides sp.]|jgi:putative colanic acid biosynthesis acetyltransferase WcaF|uniref:putative colanic acid biosynthesis acetyltransferase n=1 Tax=uncultured Parabacteroides sp. TaxID=512312 RepID=UPI0025E274D0|nr:putative colanic acid biosynthesis acetyltransferase [uncultured Parabacteroides sp.]
MKNEERLQVDLSFYRNEWGIRDKLKRACWNVVYVFAFRPLSLSAFNCWRLFLLRLFGAKLHPTVHIYSSARIWAPWNLEMDAYSCLAPHVDCYNTDLIKIGAHTIISQKSYLCASSHDISNPCHPLITAPIVIEDQVWIAADTFIAMGVKIKQGAVVGARSCVFKDVEPWTVVGGNPAREIKKRILKSE